MAKKKKDLYPSNAWEYTDWLYNTGRLTALEHLTLKNYLIKLEDDLLLAERGC